VIDHASSGGHSILTIDLDGDGGDEILGCFFGKNRGVFFYHQVQGAWKKERLLDESFDCQGLLKVDLYKTGKVGVLAISDVSHEIKYISFAGKN